MGCVDVIAAALQYPPLPSCGCKFLFIQAFLILCVSYNTCQYNPFCRPCFLSHPYISITLIIFFGIGSRILYTSTKTSFYALFYHRRMILPQNINNIIYALLVQQAFYGDTVNIEAEFLLSCIAPLHEAPSCKLASFQHIFLTLGQMKINPGIPFVPGIRLCY